MEKFETYLNQVKNENPDEYSEIGDILN